MKLPIFGKIEFMFQSTNQTMVVTIFIHHRFSEAFPAFDPKPSFPLGLSHTLEVEGTVSTSNPAILVRSGDAGIILTHILPPMWIQSCPFKGKDMYPLVSSNTAGWKIPELNGGFNRKITDRWFIFQPAMFDYRKVPQQCLVRLGIPSSPSWSIM